MLVIVKKYYILHKQCRNMVKKVREVLLPTV